MAKKKLKTTKDNLLSPISLRLTLVLLLLLTSVIGINSYEFMKFTPVVGKDTSLVSQNELMNVLGTNVVLGEDNKETYAPFMNKPEVTYWYNILSEKPDFRDAHVILASLAFNDHNCQLAKTHLTSAYAIDPTDQRLTLLEEQFKTCNN